VLGRKTKALVGLDIGSSAVKVVQLHRSGGDYRVTAVGVEPLPVDSVIDSTVIDTGVVRDAVRRAFERLNIKTREVAVALSGSGVIVKKLSLPPMTDEELQTSIQWEARQHIPFESREVSLDYQVMRTSTAGLREASMKVLLVAAKKDRVEAYTSVVEQAGCIPVVLDLDALALQNAYELNYGVHDGEVEVLANAGASVINLNVVQGGQSLFTRDVAIGGNAYTEAIKKELDLDFEDAELLKKGVPVGGVTYEDADPVIQAVTQTLLQEVSKTLDFFRATAATDQLDRIVLSGGTSRIEGLSGALSDRFDTEVELFDPFRQVPADPGVLNDDQRIDLAPLTAVAMGLALRRAKDR
jgi:type IV pilus assembly protein PilM